MLDNNLTSAGGEAATPATKKSHLSKKLLVKDKFLSKITFTKNSNSTTNNNPNNPHHDSEIFSVKQTEVIMVKDPDKNATTDSADLTNVQYKVYPQRWWILSSVVLLNLANYSHWVAFPAVAKTAAKHYDQDGETMDMIPTVSYGLGVPCCLIATYVVEKYGLKVGLNVGGILTGIGGLLCCLSTLPHLSDGLTNDTKFYLALIGQALTGIACPFISCVPTKISQHWFNDEQRAIATILLGMSNPLGIVMGQLFTPLLVHKPEDVPYMNILWFVPAGIGAIMTVLKVTNNVPPTPPSPSAALAMQQSTANRGGLEYWKNIKQLFTNWPFIILFLFVGGAMGYVSAISTKIEQILCSRGYSDVIAGVSGSLILFMGFVASFPMGLIAFKTKKPVLMTKLCGFVVITSLVLIGVFMRMPGQEAAIIVSCSLLGIFALGSYPLALELIVECTYPVDQAIGTAFIFLSSALQGVLLMYMENNLGTPFDPNSPESEIQSCVSKEETGTGKHQQPKDYSSYLNFITVYMVVMSCIYMVFFKTDMKRTKADEESATKERSKIVINAESSIVAEQEALVKNSS